MSATDGLVEKIRAAAEKVLRDDLSVAESKGADWQLKQMFNASTVLTLLSALEGAQADNDVQARNIETLVNSNGVLAEESAALRSEVTRLREALEPFAKEAPKYDPPEGDDDHLPFGVNITIGNLRRARTEINTEGHGA